MQNSFARIKALKREFIREAFQGEKLVFKHDEVFFQSKTSFDEMRFIKFPRKSKLVY